MMFRRAILFAALVTVATVAMVTAPAAAGQERANLDALDRIRDEAFKRSQVMETVSYLTDVYGPRLTGSPHLKVAADYIIERLTAWGLENPRLERWGPFGPGWSNDRFIALAISPRAYPLIAYPKAWTPGTAGAQIAEAVMALVDDESDFEKYRGNLHGKFVLTAPARHLQARFEAPARRYSAEELSNLARPDRGASAPERQLSEERFEFVRKRMQFFVDEGVGALLEPSGDGGTVFVGDGRLTAAFAAGLYPWPEPVAPQVVVAAEHYNRIARTLEKDIPVLLELDIANTYYTADADSFNVIAELPGSDKARELVIIGAHLDSWHAGTGATDNAAGSAVMLEAMRILKATGLKLRRTVRVTLWTGTEQGRLGSRAYVAQHFADPATMQPRPEHADVAAYLNLDGGTGAIRGLYLQGNEAVAPILASWMAPFKSTGMDVLSLSSTDGDHASFEAVGLPAFHFIQDPIEYETRTEHSNMDVYERLQASDLMQNAVIVASFVYQAANRDVSLPRKPLPKPQLQSAGPPSPAR